MTYAEVKANGWKDGHTAYAKGYISRKVDIDNQPVKQTARGWYYIEKPAYNTTQYYVRQYLIEK